MVKLMLLLARRAGTSPDDFAHHLQATHLPLVRQLPGLRRLVLNHIQPVPDAPPPSPSLRVPRGPRPRIRAATRPTSGGTWCA